MSNMEKNCNNSLAEHDTALSAGQMILDLLDIGDPTSFTVRQFVLAGRAFNLEPATIRSALTRLSADGRLQRLDRGHYAIGRHGETLKLRVQNWHQALARRQPWNHNWLLVVGLPENKADRTIWRRTLRALALEGFSEAESSLWVRPDNLTGDLDSVRARLQALEAAPDIMLVQACGVDMVRAERFKNLWDGPVLCQAHHELADQLEISAARIDSLELPHAASEVLSLGRTTIRAILHDPVLPESICSTAGLSRLINVMFAYQKIGKRIWHNYLGISPTH